VGAGPVVEEAWENQRFDNVRRVFRGTSGRGGERPEWSTKVGVRGASIIRSSGHCTLLPIGIFDVANQDGFAGDPDTSHLMNKYIFGAGYTSP
jgi:hypothetical protein